MPLRFASSTASFRDPALSQDRLAVLPVDGGLLVAVADGAGGISGGRRAAELALETMFEARDPAAWSIVDPHEWRETFLRADELLELDSHAGETTLVMMVIREDAGLAGASVGDSGALVIRDDARIDELTAVQHRNRRLGSGRALPATFHRSSLDGTIVVATDGLLAFVPRERIARIVTEHRHDLDATAQALIGAARLSSGSLHDDVAVVVIGASSSSVRGARPVAHLPGGGV